MLTEPEFEEMDHGGVLDIYLRDHFLQSRRFPNWTGPKDMTVLVYRLPMEDDEADGEAVGPGGNEESGTEKGN